MDIDLQYGSETVNVALPDNITVDHFQPLKSADKFDELLFLKKCQSSGFSEFIDGKSPLFVVNDGYRNTPTKLILDWLLIGYPHLLERSFFLIATGAHDKPTDEHYLSIFGKHYEKIKDRVAYHDSKDKTNLSQLGVDKLGGSVFINNLIRESDCVVAIGSVEPHYFAGYTGGRKSFFPGLTDFNTIERNHNLANSLEAQPLQLFGNPVAEHLAELMLMLDESKIYTFQIVNDSEQNIADIFQGNITSAFPEAVRKAKELYNTEIDDQYDIVLCEVNEPLDKNLYQIQKAVENNQSAVADNGALLVLAPCEEGIGSEYFYELAKNWDIDNNRPGDGRISFGSHKLSRILTITNRIDLYCYCELPDEQVRHVFYKPVANINNIFENIKREGVNFQGRVAVINDATHTVVTLSQ